MKRKLIKILLPFILLFACLGFAACGTPDRLDTPANLRIKDGVLSWDKVKYADGYSVYIDGEEYQTAQCNYDISELNEGEIHTLEVRAYTNGGILSPYADIAYTGKYAIPTEGLEIDLLGKGDYLHGEVSKLSVNEDGWCVIPATYQGIRVTNFTAEATSAQVLSKIKGIYLPSSINNSHLYGSRFKGFANLENIVLGEGNEKFVSEGNCIIERETNTLVVGCIGSEIPDYVTKIGSSAFTGRDIKEITIPNTVTEMENNVFHDCAVLERATLPERLISNSLSYTFRGCTSLKGATVPEGITRLRGTFWGCTSLTEFKVPEGITDLNEAFHGCTSLTDVTLPESVRELYYTFQSCTALKSVKIPSGVKTLQGTFWFCTALESIEVPGSVQNLQGTFYGCTSLKSAVISDGVIDMNYIYTLSGKSYGTFENCTALTDVRLPATLERIGPTAFRNCISLKAIEIPESVTRIDFMAFENCTSLKSVKLPKNLAGMFYHTLFSGCTSLEAIVIPESITRLGSSSFENCTSLKSVVLPKVIEIAYSVFTNCPLEEVYYRGTEEEWDENLGKIYKNNTELLSAPRYYYSETAPEEEGNYWHFVDGVPTKWE